MTRINIWLLATLLLATACSLELRRTNIPAPTDDEAIPIPEETAAYIDMSRAALARQIGIDSAQIELESVTEPASTDGTYVVKLVTGDKIYQYHGRDGEIRLISISEPAPSE